MMHLRWRRQLAAAGWLLGLLLALPSVHAVTITDDRGRALRFDQPPQRIGPEHADQFVCIGLLQRRFGELFGIGIDLQHRIQQLEQLRLAQAVFTYDDVQSGCELVFTIGQWPKVLEGGFVQHGIPFFPLTGEWSALTPQTPSAPHAAPARGWRPARRAKQ